MQSETWTGAVVNLAIAQVNKTDTKGAFKALINTELKVTGTSKSGNENDRASAAQHNTLLVRLAHHLGIKHDLINTYHESSNGIKSETYEAQTATLAVSTVLRCLINNADEIVHDAKNNIDKVNLTNGNATKYLLEALNDFDPNYSAGEVFGSLEDEIEEAFGEAPTPTETVATTINDGDFIPLAELVAMTDTPEKIEEVQALALQAFKGTDNINGDGHLRFRTNGKTTGQLKVATLETGMRCGSEQKGFNVVVLKTLAFNMVGIYSRRGVKNQHSLIYAEKAVLTGKHSDTLTALAAALIVKAGVTKFNHDLRKYISPSDIAKIRAAFFKDDSVIDAPVLGTAATTWLLPEYKGAYEGGSDEDRTQAVIDSLASLL